MFGSKKDVYHRSPSEFMRDVAVGTSAIALGSIELPLLVSLNILSTAALGIEGALLGLVGTGSAATLIGATPEAAKGVVIAGGVITGALCGLATLAGGATLLGREYKRSIKDIKYGMRRILNK